MKNIIEYFKSARNKFSDYFYEDKKTSNSNLVFYFVERQRLFYTDADIMNYRGSPIEEFSHCALKVDDDSSLLLVKRAVVIDCAQLAVRAKSFKQTTSKASKKLSEKDISLLIT